MTMITEYLLLTLQALLLLFVFFAALFTALRIARRHGIDKWTGFVWLFKALALVFIVCDWLVNMLISPLMLDLPGWWGELVTGRLKRYQRAYANRPRMHLSRRQIWRLEFALFICSHLNHYDPDHC